jgi:TonB family protein
LCPVKLDHLKQPAATYTEEAKAHKVEGSVVLQVSLGRDGKASVMEVVQGLPYGLTEQAIAVVRGIRFAPAQRNNLSTTVSRVMTYNFKLD